MMASINPFLKRFALFLSLVGTLLCSAQVLAASNHLDGVRIWAAPDSTRVVFDLKKSPDYSYFTLKSPNRLVVDLAHTGNRVNLGKITNNSKLVKRVRTSKPLVRGPYGW